MVVTVEQDGHVRVSRSGPVLPFRVPVAPAWLAVAVMALVVVAAAAVAVVAVMSS